MSNSQIHPRTIFCFFSGGKNVNSGFNPLNGLSGITYDVISLYCIKIDKTKKI